MGYSPHYWDQEAVEDRLAVIEVGGRLAAASRDSWSTVAAASLIVVNS